MNNGNSAPSAYPTVTLEAPLWKHKAHNNNLHAIAALTSYAMLAIAFYLFITDKSLGPISVFLISGLVLSVMTRKYIKFACPRCGAHNSLQKIPKEPATPAVTKCIVCEQVFNVVASKKKKK